MRIKIFFITLILVLSLSAMFLANKSLRDTNTNLNNQLQQQEQLYSGKLDEFTTYQETLFARIQSLETNYEALQVAYNELDSAYKAFIQDSTLIQEELQATIDNLNETIAGLEQNPDVESGDVESLRQQIANLEESLANQTVTIEELQATVQQQEATITALNARIEELTGDLNGDLAVNYSFYEGLLNGSLKEIKAEDLEGISAIRPYAFAGCYSLQTVQLPNSCQRVGSYAFKDCSNLSEFSTGNLAIEFDRSVFTDLFNDFTLNLNCKSVNAQGAFEVYEMQSSLTINYTGTMIDYCSNENLMFMSNWNPLPAFNLIINGETITFLNGNNLSGVTSIPAYAFFNYNITEVYMPSSLTIINPGAFCMLNLNSFSFYDSALTIIPQGTLVSCNVNYLEFNDCINVIDSYALTSCTFNQVVIPSTVTNINPGAFADSTFVEGLMFEETSQWTDQNSNVITLEAGVDYSQAFSSGEYAELALTKIS